MLGETENETTIANRSLNETARLVDSGSTVHNRLR